MVSIAHLRHDHEKFDMMYPEQSRQQLDPALEMGLSPESYSAYQPSVSYPTTITYSGPALCAADAPYLYSTGSSSPGMYAEDLDMGLPSCNLSTNSVSSSTSGSPLSHHSHLVQLPGAEWGAAHSLDVSPGIVDQSDYYHSGGEYSSGEYSYAAGMDGYNPQFDFVQAKGPGFVDPSLILPHPDMNRSMGVPFENSFPQQNAPYPTSPGLSPSPQQRTGSTSPYMNTYQQFSPFPAPVDDVRVQRRPSLVSYNSSYSGEQTFSGDESREKTRCPHPECGRLFKDLKAHMLTHMTERPEKCPITTCEYHVKGFARKYDKNRHTLTHYKGTMVCGFCPGSGSAVEKSFNRADVFKRHLTAVHGVEQTPPNSRKKATGAAAKKLSGYGPDATGKCSTCSATFQNAQDFYEHLDDCVLRIVQQEDPAEAINAQRLAEVENDREVHMTLEKNKLPTTTMVASVETEDDDFVDAEEDDFKALGGLKKANKKSKGNPANGVQKSRGMTHSRGGVPLPNVRRGRKNRRDYPSSWGFDKGQMTMKKRVMAVFEGPRRLGKDDMMLSTEHEVRVPLSDGKSYVTDLDVQTLKRAQGFLGATEEEKGPWISDDPSEDDLKKMLECRPTIQVRQ